MENRNVVGTVFLDHQHAGGTRHDHDIIYSGLFVNPDEIAMDWDVPNADSGTGTWKRVSYTGNAYQAVVTEENALSLATDAWIASDTGGRIQLYFLTGDPTNVDETIEGFCGGTARIVGTIDDQTGFFDGTLTYNEYCEEIFSLDGVAEFSGHTDLASGNPFHYLYNFSDITLVTDEDSYTVSGRKGFDFTDPQPEMLMSFVFLDNNLLESYWLKDLILEFAEILDYFELNSAIGRFYDPEFGYVDLSIEDTIQINDPDRWPVSGTMILTGVEGTQGGNTKARLNFLSATEFLVEADTDGDGLYNDYSSGTLLWSDI